MIATMNAWISKRGDAVDRSKPVSPGVPVAHLIKRDELEKVIRLIKELVKATEAYRKAWIASVWTARTVLALMLSKVNVVPVDVIMLEP